MCRLNGLKGAIYKWCTWYTITINCIMWWYSTRMSIPEQKNETFKVLFLCYIFSRWALIGTRIFDNRFNFEIDWYKFTCLLYINHMQLQTLYKGVTFDDQSFHGFILNRRSFPLPLRLPKYLQNLLIYWSSSLQINLCLISHKLSLTITYPLYGI